MNGRHDSPRLHLWAVTLANALLGSARGDRWQPVRMKRAARSLFGEQPSSEAKLGTALTRLLRRLRAELPTPPYTRRSALVEAILAGDELIGWVTSGSPRSPVNVPLGPDRMGPARWEVVPLATTADLGNWLGVGPNELDWLADRRNLLRTRSGSLHHYRWRWIPKRTGGQRNPKRGEELRELFDRIPWP